MESSEIEDSNQMKDSKNIFETESNISKGEVNQQRNKKSPNIKNEEISKEQKENTNINEKNKNIRNFTSKEEQIPKKIFHKKVQVQKNQKKKKNINPFLTENNTLEHNKPKKNSKFEINKNSIKLSYLNNYKNDHSEIKDSSINKTVFSKISENMYKNSKEDKFPIKNARNLELENEETYNKLTEEAFLCSCANKTNKENKKIIYEFLDRKKKQQESKKIRIDLEKENEIELDSLKDIKRLKILTDRNRSYKSSRTFNEFLKDQRIKQEKHENHLKNNENLKKEKLDSIIRDRPLLNEETKKLANSTNRDPKTKIHSRLYQEFNEKKKKEEEKEKEKGRLKDDKSHEKKLSKIEIQKNIERLFNEYNVKKKRIDENEIKREKEIKNLSSNHSTSKNSNEIIFKRFKNILKDSLEDIIQKKLNDDFQISYSDFTKLLYKINFTTKNYFQLLENKNNNTDLEQESHINESPTNKSLYKKHNFELDKEYKLLIDSWKIITKNKEFKNNVLGTSKRTLLFLLSVLGIYNENTSQNFIKKEFSSIIKDINGSISNYSNLSKQIYKYFSLYRNNAVNGLLFREKEQKKRLELENEIEKNLTFSPSMEKSSKNFMESNASVNEMRLSVEKNYEQYRKNKESKLREKEKIIEKQEKEKCPFFPCGSKTNVKKDVLEISKRLYNSGLKHLKNSFSTPNNFNIQEKSRNENILKKSAHSNYNIQKMFENNPLEKDIKVQKKIKELKESRNKKSLEKLIIKKGFRPKEDFKNGDWDEYAELNDKNERFAYDDEPLNNFKNTFNKYERFDKKLSKREKYAFEIIVDRKPQKLIIYQGDDICYKVKEFCNMYKLNFNDRRRIYQTISQQLK